MIVIVTSNRFRGLANPFTGERMVVKMTIPKDRVPKFFAPDTYTPCAAFPSAKESCEAAQRRGSVRVPAAPTCPYTGEPLEQQFVDGLGWFYVGGFDPRVPRTADEFLYYATMRDGKPVLPKSEPVSRVGYLEPRHDETPDPDQPERTEEAHQIAKGVVEQFKDKVGMVNEKTVVSTARPKSKRHGKGRK